MNEYDIIIGNLMRNTVELRKYVVKTKQVTAVHAWVDSIQDKLDKLDAYMSYGDDNK